MSRLQRFVVRVGAIASKETIHVLRDPRTLGLALAMPVLLLLLFGFGVSFEIDRLPVALVDLDRTPTSRAIGVELYASGELVPPSGSWWRPIDRQELASPERATELLQTGRAVAVVTLPRGTERDLGSGVAVQLAVDGRDGTVANQVLAKCEGILRASSRRLLEAPPPPVSAAIWTRYNPEARSPIFLVPGLAAYLMAIAAVLLTALTVATEWERGSMEQLFASPVGRLEIILGKLLPYVLVGMLQLLLVLTVGGWIFDVPLRGSPALLFAAGFVFLLGMLGQGLLVSVLAKSQLVATQAGALTSLLPSLLLSGLVFPIENMPTVLQGLSQLLPARHMVTTTRAIMLRGWTLTELWPELLAMAVFALVMVAAATARFQRRLA